MSKRSVSAVAHSLTRTWINGNRKDAIAAIVAEPPARAAAIAAYVYDYLGGHDDTPYHRGVFMRMLETAAENV